MRFAAVLVVPALALTLTACSEAQEAADAVQDSVNTVQDTVDTVQDTVDTVGDTAGKAQDCAGLARDIAATGLNLVPSEAEARAAKQALEARVQDIGEGAVREAADNLSDTLGEFIEAVRTADADQVQAKAADVREAIAEAARACSIPVEQFTP